MRASKAEDEIMIKYSEIKQENTHDETEENM